MADSRALEMGIIKEIDSHTLVFRGPPSSNVAVGVWRMNDSGPNSVMSSARLILNADGEFHFPLYAILPDGLYLVLMNTSSTPPTKIKLENPRAAQPLLLSEGILQTQFDQEKSITAALAAQDAFRHREIRADDFVGNNRLIVRILVEGCFLDYHQHFEGGFLKPITSKLGAEHVVSVINEILPEGINFNADRVKESHSRQHPICLVTFINVQASDIAGAAKAVQTRLARVLGALAEDRGASPQVLAYLSEDMNGKHEFALPTHTYRGNLLPGFGPGVTNLLDLIEIAGRSDPWIDFALNLMRSIRLQTNNETQLFQAWSLIEAAAKRVVPPDKTKKIFNDLNQPINTAKGPLDQSRDLGRVIIYLRDYVTRNSLSGALLKTAPDFYDQVRLLYDCRNRIAHEGGLASPASSSPIETAANLAFTARDWAAEVLKYEIRRAVK